MSREIEHEGDIGFVEAFAKRWPRAVFETLLRDRTTGKNIIWADSEYEELGDGYAGDDEVTVEKIFGEDGSSVVKPRIAKEAERQNRRTKTRAEVFTPSWLCNKMNNDLDEAWFGKRYLFNVEGMGGWSGTELHIPFSKSTKHGWQSYIKSTRLEITCGEAPFICSRYDTVTGEALPIRERIGIIDRKLRVVNENVKTRKTWIKWAHESLKATYGFEYQGDNLLIARINVLETFAEHCEARWGKMPTPGEINEAARIVSWNFWQMNGFTDAVPTNKMGAEVGSTLGSDEPKGEQTSMFDLFGDAFAAVNVVEAEQPKEKTPLCVLQDWKTGEFFEFASLKGREMEKKFFAVIGNPPYQMEGSGNKTFAPPIYHEFMDAAYEVGEKVELVTPARFLFNAGSTPKEWNRKMLDDAHLKVELYEADASTMFPGTDIKGGVAVTYRDSARDFGAIGTFTAFEELNSILKKAGCVNENSSLASIIYTQVRFNLEALYSSHPEMKSRIGSNGKDKRFRNNIFDKIPLFKEEECNGAIKVLGIQKNKRVFRFIDRCLVDMEHENLSKYKVLVPRANGSGALGEILSTPLIGTPLIGYTQSFIGIGSFDSELEAQACMKYVKSKFARALLGILKITQDNDRGVWRLIPLQDFTAASDIDWSKSVAEIDRQLYAKYGLDEDEIEFIETHVKEMD